MFKIRTKRAIAVLFAALSVSLISGCQQSENKPLSQVISGTSRSSEADASSGASQPQSSSASMPEVSEPLPSQESSAPQAHGKGDRIRAGKVNITLDDVYLTYDIVTGDEHRYPKDNKVFIVCELSFENTYADPEVLDIAKVLTPYYDAESIDLSALRAVYPKVLNEKQNLIDKQGFTVYNGEKSDGFIIFEADKSFSTAGVRCNDPDTGAVTDYFVFENLPQASETGSSAQSGTEPVISAEAGELTFTLLELTDAPVDAYVDTSDFWEVRLSVSNTSRETKIFTFNDLILSVGNEYYQQLFSSNEVISIPAGESSEGSVIFAVPKGTKQGRLFYVQREGEQTSYPLFMLNKS